MKPDNFAANEAVGLMAEPTATDSETGEQPPAGHHRPANAHLPVLEAFICRSSKLFFNLRWAPIEFGVLWAVVLGIIGFRMCRLATKEG
jgi:hypothetical protein